MVTRSSPPLSSCRYASVLVPFTLNGSCSSRPPVGHGPVELCVSHEIMSPEFSQLLGHREIYSILILSIFVLNVVTVGFLTVCVVYGKVRIAWLIIAPVLLCFMTLAVKMYYWGQLNAAASSNGDFTWISERDGGAVTIPLVELIFTIVFLLGISVIAMKVASWYKDRG